MIRIDVQIVPDLFGPSGLTERNHVVLIDVLRASTTIIAALHAGCSGIYPVSSLEEASSLADRLGNNPLKGGERWGVAPPGFDLGNSPEDYTPERVFGREIVYTTTNGTRALAFCGAARAIYFASFVNRAALIQAMVHGGRWNLVCAGTDGEPSLEDSLFAGSVIQKIERLQPISEINDAGRLCQQAWSSLESSEDDDSNRLLRAFRRSRGGQALLKLGFERDLEFASKIDRFSGLPMIFPTTSGLQVRLAEPR